MNISLNDPGKPTPDRDRRTAHHATGLDGDAARRDRPWTSRRGRSAPRRWTPCCSRVTGAAAGAAAPRRGSSRRILPSWDQAPAPAQVGKRLVEGLFQVELPAQPGPVDEQRHPLGVRDARGPAVRRRRGLTAHPADCSTACRSARPSGRPGTWSCRQRSCTSRSGSTTARRWPRTSARISSSASERRPRCSCCPLLRGRSRRDRHGCRRHSGDPEGVRRAPGLRAAGRFAQWIYRRAASRRGHRLGARPPRGDRGVRGRRRGGYDRAARRVRGQLRSRKPASDQWPVRREPQPGARARDRRAHPTRGDRRELFPGDPSAGAVSRMQRLLGTRQRPRATSTDPGDRDAPRASSAVASPSWSYPARSSSHRRQAPCPTGGDPSQRVGHPSQR